jgi:hypothetical protein
MGEWMYRSMYSWPRLYLEVSGQLNAPAALPPRNEHPVLIWYEAGWAPESVWTPWRRENSWAYRDSNSDRSVVQHVSSRYIDYAIPAPKIYDHREARTHDPEIKGLMVYRSAHIWALAYLHETSSFTSVY